MWFKNNKILRESLLSHIIPMRFYFRVMFTDDELISHFHKDFLIEEWLKGKGEIRSKPSYVV